MLASTRTSLTKTTTFCQVQVQGGLLAARVRYPSSRRITRTKRGVITLFSKRSRHRCLKRCSTLDFSTFRGSFITLTYENVQRDVKTAKNHLRAFLKGLYERPEVQNKIGCAVWRYELQERGSIHFHVLLQRAPFIHWSVIRHLWAVASNQDESRVVVDIEEITHQKKAMHYVSKYIAKVQFLSILDNVPYLASGDFPQSRAPQEITGRWTGRHWGIEFRKLAIWHPAHWFSWRGSTASITKLKIIASRILETINLTDGKGFTLFIDSAEAWYAIVKQVLAREKCLGYRQQQKLGIYSSIALYPQFS